MVFGIPTWARMINGRLSFLIGASCPKKTKGKRKKIANIFTVIFKRKS
jgi:hypothetical protein